MVENLQFVGEGILVNYTKENKRQPERAGELFIR
jgi:hypothetical protein